MGKAGVLFHGFVRKLRRTTKIGDHIAFGLRTKAKRWLDKERRIFD